MARSATVTHRTSAHSPLRDGGDTGIRAGVDAAAHSPARKAPSVNPGAAVPRPAGVPVLPAVDANLGTVDFACQGRWERRWCAEPAALIRALSNTVRPSRWCAGSETLIVIVAATGHRHGVEVFFPLKAAAA